MGAVSPFLLSWAITHSSTTDGSFEANELLNVGRDFVEEKTESSVPVPVTFLAPSLATFSAHGTAVIPAIDEGG